MSTVSKLPPTDELLAELPVDAALAFAPIHKRAMGVACGLIGGLAVALVTAFHVIVFPDEQTYLRLLAQYFAGYRPDWTGVFVGGFWGFVTCFVFGWFAAFVRNLAMATLVFIARTREELKQTRDFLDHI